MALNSTTPSLYPSPPLGRDAAALSPLGTSASARLEADTHRVAHSFSALHDLAGKSITAIVARTGSAATPAPLKVRIETSDSGGYPSGTLAWAGAEGTVASPTANTTTTFTLTTAGSFTPGTTYHIVFSRSGAGAIDLYLARLGSTAAYGMPAQLRSTDSGTTWANQGGTVAVYVLAGAVACNVGGLSLLATSNDAYSLSTASRNEVATYWPAFPKKIRVVGIVASLSSTAGAQFEARLYPASGPHVASATQYNSLVASGTPGYYALPTPVVVNVGDAIRASIKPTTSASVTLTSANFPSLAAQGGVGLVDGGQYSARLDAGDWTETATKRPLIWLVYDQEEDGTGGGGGGGVVFHPGMTGGFNG